MSHLRQLAAEIQLHLLEEYSTDQWLMTDSATYSFFKERALKGKPMPMPSTATPTQPPKETPKEPAKIASTPIRAPTPSASPVPPTPPVPVPSSPPPSKAFQLTAPAPAFTPSDPGALKTLLAQVAPKLTIRDTPATKEELTILPQVLILCPSTTPQNHRVVLENLCKAITRTWVPCEVVDPTMPRTQELLSTSLSWYSSEGDASLNAPFLSIPSIEALLQNPQEKIALWKELTARLAP